MFAADSCPGNCLKAFRLDFFFTDLTGAEFPEFDPCQCPVYGLDLFLLCFVQYCQNISHSLLLRCFFSLDIVF